jgi:hypothetical protein
MLATPNPRLRHWPCRPPLAKPPVDAALYFTKHLPKRSPFDFGWVRSLKAGGQPLGLAHYMIELEGSRDQFFRLSDGIENLLVSFVLPLERLFLGIETVASRFFDCFSYLFGALLVVRLLASPVIVHAGRTPCTVLGFDFCVLLRGNRAHANRAPHPQQANVNRRAIAGRTLELRPVENLAMGAIFTVASIIRSYCLRTGNSCGAPEIYRRVRLQTLC